MQEKLFASASAIALALSANQALAQEQIEEGAADPIEDISPAAEAAAEDFDSGVIYVTSTRREQELQDVPLSVTAFQQEQLTEQGIVGYEGLARETPGVVVNKPTANFNNFTARGIATNGYGANLQGTVAIYIDELPISANGNSTILDPTLFDVERVEFLRGPQGTLFGANSLAGAMRFITKSPDLDEFEAAGLVDFGLTDGDALRQRYNGMVNVPLVEGKLAFRGVGFVRHEDGWVDNIGTGVEGSNVLESYGGRAMLLWEPVDALGIRLTALHENSTPEDSALVNPNLGEYVRRSDEPDLFHANLDSYNLAIELDLGFADLTSSSTLASFDQAFVVDLAGTFGNTIPFALDAFAFDDLFVQEVRLASSTSGPFEWIIGGFYFDKTRTVDFNYRTSQEFLDARNLTGLPNEYFLQFITDTDQYELAGFGELTYRFGDDFWLTGGIRYTKTSVQSFTRDGGYDSDYFVAALFGFQNYTLNLVDIAQTTGLRLTTDKVSWKASASWQPNEDITTYATVSTGFRSPIVNARAGDGSLTDPDDIIIPDGATSDSLINYEIGLKGSWLDGDIRANIAAYYIDWDNIQVQANRVSDQIQFATNIGGAISKGVEIELFMRPAEGLSVNINGSYNDSEVNELTPAEAAISGAEDGIQLAFPEWQGSATVRYDFPLGGNTDGFLSATAAHTGAFPGLFPNIPGQPGVQNPTYDFTEAHEVVNLSAGAYIGDWTVIAYVENLFDTDAITYVHPEAFLDSRYAKQRPLTFGLRVGFDF